MVMTVACVPRMESAGDRVLAERSYEQALTAHRLGDYASALGELIRARALFESIGDRTALVRSLELLRVIYRDSGDMTRALDAARDAVSLAWDTGDLSLLGQVALGRAEIRLLTGDEALGHAELQRSIAIALQRFEPAGQSRRQSATGCNHPDPEQAWERSNTID